MQTLLEVIGGKWFHGQTFLNITNFIGSRQDDKKYMRETGGKQKNTENNFNRLIKIETDAEAEREENGKNCRGRGGESERARKCEKRTNTIYRQKEEGDVL